MIELSLLTGFIIGLYLGVILAEWLFDMVSNWRE